MLMLLLGFLNLYQRMFTKSKTRFGVSVHSLDKKITGVGLGCHNDGDRVSQRRRNRGGGIIGSERGLLARR